MITLKDGPLWQWETGCQVFLSLEIGHTIKEIDFSNDVYPDALPVDVKEVDGKLVAPIPNVLLQSAGNLRIHLVTINEGKRVLEEALFRIHPRKKPLDYVYTDDEVVTIERLVEQALIEAKESGDFTGPQGPKGDAGSIEFKIVAELPTENIDESVMYLLQANGEGDNKFLEYIYVDGAWECIGSASVEVKLNDYVKNTDYASSLKAGVVKASVEYGIDVMKDGVMFIVSASKDEINNRKYNPNNLWGYHPIVLESLDYAVKKALSDCKLSGGDAWKDEEKAKALELLGGVPKFDGSKETGKLRFTVYAQELGEQVQRQFSSVPTENALAVYGSGATLQTNLVRNELDCTNKKYVDNLIAGLRAEIEALKN